MSIDKAHGWTFRENSLDLLRLIAATQVAVLHSFEFTMHEVTGHWAFELLRLFPGVPIFFFISGYLITKSFERSPSLLDYLRNRGLRIFPALILCVFVNLLMVGWTGYFEEVNASFADIAILFVAKTTILQFYNPDFMRAFGDGVLNGSLWTICVELQFYLVVPILYRLFSLKEKSQIGLLLGLLAIFMIFNRLLYLSSDEYSDFILWKLFRVSFIPWIYMFLFGMFVQRNFDFFANLISRVNLFLLAFAYITFAYSLSKLGLEFGNGIPPYVYFPLAILVFRFAYYKPEFTHQTLKGNDISYGIYIWHMPLVNQLLFISEKISVLDVVAVIVLSICLALISWVLLEKNMLKLKHFSLQAGTKS